MKKHYKEKHLQATIYKIENVKREQNFLIQHLWKVIVFGIGFSFWAPTHQPEGALMQKRDSLIESYSEFTYCQLVILSGTTYLILCLLFHFSSMYQDKKRLRKLNALKTKLEKEISELKN